MDSTASDTTEDGASGLPPRPDRNVGKRLGPFVLEERLGQGAMGLVFRARHDDGRQVALKIVARVTKTSGRRFVRETNALRALDHPNVVRFLEASEGPPAWLAMDYVQGQTLEDHLRDGALSFAEAARIVAEIAEGVAHAHANAIMHRDLKPENILMRADDGRALVTDFGLARDLDASRFTQTGTMVGTVAYMSPEQVQGSREIGRPTDVWALGAILYRCICDRDPFLSDSNIATVAGIAQASYPKPRSVAPDVPPALEQAVLSCLVANPAKRPTAAELAETLRSYVPSEVPTRRGRGARVVGAVLGVALMVAAVWLGTRPGPPPPVSVVPEVDPTAAAPSAPAPPWPESGGGWRRAWLLGEGPAPTVDHPALWSEPGRTAAPLSALGDASGLEAAFFGAAEPAGGGRVRVHYTDLGRALVAEVRSPSNHFVLAEPPSGEVVPRGEGAEILAANDIGEVWLTLGEARWEAPRVTARMRRVAAVDGEVVTLRLGPDVPGAKLMLNGRGGTISVAGARVRHGLRSAWQEVEFAPGGEAPRVRVGSANVEVLDAAAQSLPKPGSVQFCLMEMHLGLEQCVVEGRPRRTDVPALARVPGDVPTNARVAARFAQEGDGLGGPFVGLADADGRLALSLEVDGSRLVLRKGSRLLAVRELDARPRAGWLLLERRADRIRGVLDESAPVVLDVLDPLPLAAPLRAAYGSTAPRVAFEVLEVQVGPEDSERRALDAAFSRRRPDQALILLEGGSTPLSAWRRGALLLAQASDPALADPLLLGVPGRVGRLRQTEQAGDLLLAASARLEGAAREDALARAVLAYVAGSRLESAQRVARELIGAVGSDAARARIDGLEREDGRPALLERLSTGWVSATDPQIRAVGLQVGLIFTPEHEGRILLDLGDCIRHGRPRPDPRTPEGRRTLEEVLALCKRARALGESGPKADNAEAEVFTDLGRFEEAIERWNRLVPQEQWWPYLRRAACYEGLGRFREALESALGALSVAARRPSLWQYVRSLCVRLAKTGRDPGLVSVGLVTLGAITGDAALVEQASAVAQSAPADSSRDGDLLAFARAKAGVASPVRDSDRPTAILVRALAGDAAARAALRVAGKADPLVRHLALLDATLAPIVR